jgi:hypothetical protein
MVSQISTSGVEAAGKKSFFGPTLIDKRSPLTLFGAFAAKVVL